MLSLLAVYLSPFWVAQFQSVSWYLPLDSAVTLEEVITPKFSLLPLFHVFLTPHICQMSCLCKHFQTISLAKWPRLWNELFKLFKPSVPFSLKWAGKYSHCFTRRNLWSWYFKREERTATLMERHDDTGSSGHFFHCQLVLAENIFLLLLSACRASAPERLQWLKLGTSQLCGFASMNQHFLKDVLHCAHLHDTDIQEESRS